MDTINSILARIREADAEERQAESARPRDVTAAARAKKREALTQLRTAYVHQRESVLAAKHEVLATLADERTVLSDKAADLTTQLTVTRDRLKLIDRKIVAAQQARDRIALQPTKAVTVRLDRLLDRLVPPAECQLLDPLAWIALVVEGATKGEHGAWAVDFTFNEHTGQLVGPAKFHYEVPDAERRARQDQVAREIAERRAVLQQADPSGQGQREAAAEARR